MSRSNHVLLSVRPEFCLSVHMDAETVRMNAEILETEDLGYWDLAEDSRASYIFLRF